MNFKKLKRLTSVVLSLSMVLSMNMTAFAMETAPVESVTEEIVHEHVLVVDQAQSTPATCGEEGIEVKVCECGYSETETVAATGEHTQESKLDETTNEVVTSCSECGEELSRAPYENNFDLTAEGDAGDTTDNTTAFEKCQSHNPAKVARIPADCWTEGKVAHYACPNCSDKWVYRSAADAAGQTNYVAAKDPSLTIQRANHNAVRTMKVDATCTTGGNKEYFNCSICGRFYETIENAYLDIKEGRTVHSGQQDDEQASEEEKAQEKYNVARESLDIAAKGHHFATKGSAEDSPETRTISFNWDNFQPQNYVENEACNVTASRGCGNCDYEQTAQSVSVHKTLSESFNCTTEDNDGVDYTATATFTTEEGELWATDEPSSENDTYHQDVTGHVYKYTFNWGSLELMANDEGKLAFKGEVTLTRQCNICETPPEQTDTITADVTVKNAASGTDYPLTCEAQKATLVATATFADETSAKTEEKEDTLPIGLHAMTIRHEAKMATCDDPGHNEHWECANCHGLFWDEDDAKGKAKEEGLTEAQINIPAYGHNFGLPVFAVTDTVLITGTASFSCIHCDATFTKSCTIDPKDFTYTPAEGTDTPSCGDTVDINYKATVEFDKNSVSNNGGIFQENTESPDYAPLPYTGRATVKRVALKHKFTPAYAWNDSSDASKGIKVTLTCDTCKGTVIIDSISGVDSGSTISSISEGASVETALSPADTENGYIAPTCINKGMDVYHVTVSGATEDNDAATNFSTAGYKTIETPANGHTYGFYNVNTEDETTIPPNVSELKVKCTACADIDYSLTRNSDIVKAVPDEVTQEGEHGYTPATCSKGGNRVWVVMVTITESSGEIPAVYIPEETAAAEGETEEAVYTITRSVPKLGHNFTSPVTWDWSAFGEVTGENIVPYETKGAVYAVYMCVNSNCDGLEDDETETEANAEYGAANGKRVKKIPATVSDDKDSQPYLDCTNGTITYTATAGTETPDEKKQQLSGHSWGDIIWTEWVKTDKTESENDFTISVFDITACRECSVCEDIERYATESGTDSENNSVLGGVEITHSTPDPNGCTTAGSTIYFAKVTTSDGEVVKNTMPHIDTYKPLGHDYVIDWKWFIKTENDSEPVPVTPENEKAIGTWSATAQKKCTRNCGSVPIETQGLPSVTCNKTIEDISCEETDVFIYTAKAAFKDVPTDEYTGQKMVVYEGKGHDYKWTIDTWPEEGKVLPGTYTITVKGECQNNKTKHNVTLTDASFRVEEAGITQADATCMTGPTLEVTGSFTGQDAENNTYSGTATYKKPSGEPVETAHSYKPAVINWTKPLTGGTKNEDAGTITYEVTAKAECVYDTTAKKRHTRDIIVIATASIEDVNAICCTADYEITYNLSLENTEQDKDITLKDGAQYKFSHSAEETHVGPMKRWPAVEGDCVTPGHRAYYECQECKKAYSNAAGTLPYDGDVTAPLGHRYGDPQFAWDADGKTVRAIFTCNRAGCQEIYAGHTKALTAELDTNSDGTPQKFTETEATCPLAPEPKPGLDYYMVSLTLSNDDKASGAFEKDQYHGDVPFVVQPTEHTPDKDDATKCKHCGNTITNLVKIIFQNAAGQEYVSIWKNKSDENLSITLPGGPNRTGYTFKGWDKSVTEITDEIKTTDKTEVIVKPVYDKDDLTGSIIVKYVQMTKNEDKTETLSPITGQDNKSYEGTVGAYVTVKPEAIHGLIFSHWADENGVMLSTADEYRVSIVLAAGKTIQAVYVADENDKKDNIPTVVISDKYATTTETTHKVSFVSSVNVPDNFEIVEVGILYCTNSTVGADKTLMVVGSGSTKVKKVIFTEGDNKTNILTMDVGANEANWGRDIFARGYAICQNKESKEQVIVYSGIESDNYAHLSGNTVE